MRLAGVRVRNIRSYEAATLDVGPGTTLIAGDVGAGKTSLLYAVEMALFGVAEIDAAFLVRHGAGRAEVAVTFEDDAHRYEVVRSFRHVRRRGKEAFEPESIVFRTDGAATRYSATELRQRVIDLLGFPDNPNPHAHSDLWRWAVYVPQERMRDILSAAPEERLATVRKALGVERYVTAADNAQDLAHDLRRTAGQRRAEADRLRHFEEAAADAAREEDRFRAEAAHLRQSVAARDAEIARLRDALREADLEVARAEADLREEAGLRTELERDRIAGETLERRRTALQSDLARQRELRIRGEAPDLARLAGEVERAEAVARRARDELDLYAQSLRALSEARVAAEAAVRREREARRRVAVDADALAAATAAEATARVAGPEHEPPAPTPHSLAEIDEEREHARRREEQSVRELARRQTALHELDELLTAGVCPRCHQSVERATFEPHRRDDADAVSAAEAAHRSRVADRERWEAERGARERYERAHERWVDAERRRAEARAAVSAATATWAADGAEAEAAAAQAREMADRLRTLEPVGAEESQRRRAVQEADREYRARQEALTAGRLELEQQRTVEATIAALAAEGSRVEGDLDALGTRTAGRRERLAELATTAAARTALSDRAHRLRGELDSTERLRADETESSVRTETRVENELRRRRDAERGIAERHALLAEADEVDRRATWVNGAFRLAVLEMEQQLLAHAKAAFEREFARYFAALVDDPALAARIDGAFTPWVTIEGEWTPAEALSGGERTSLALAFRLALARVVRTLGELHLDTLLLDEPTDGFSPEQVVRMGELLDQLALPQVVVVSHESELSAIADRIVRVEKRDGRSVLVGVSSPEAPPESVVAP